MRILVYWEDCELKQFVTFNIVKRQKVRESLVGAEYFDIILTRVKARNYRYNLYTREEKLIESNA